MIGYAAISFNPPVPSLEKVCRFAINEGSCENIVSTEVVQKLNIETEKHPKPYKLAWLKKGGEVVVAKRALVSFSISQKYKDVVWCDVVAMNVFHLLLGRPWQYDQGMVHDGRANTYSFIFEGIRIVLMPCKQGVSQSKPTSEGTILLSLIQLEEELKQSTTGYMLMGKEVNESFSVPVEMAPLVAEFSDVFPDELLDRLPLLRDIQHYINLE